MEGRVFRLILNNLEAFMLMIELNGLNHIDIVDIDSKTPPLLLLLLLFLLSLLLLNLFIYYFYYYCCF